MFLQWKTANPSFTFAPAQLLDTHNATKQDGEEKAALHKIILKLRAQLKDLERIDLEKADIASKLQALEEELKHRVSWIFPG